MRARLTAYMVAYPIASGPFTTPSVRYYITMRTSLGNFVPADDPFFIYNSHMVQRHDGMLQMFVFIEVS